ncbi:LDL receptor wingless signaling/trafficking chaperone [Thalictrum thalictroides]|uniref:LDL receptor wingless signaling/trafficking chaperone n=1 Tax=Thalictrum thalictroides TaxID=46969 RepID=A0A7J6UZZ3_THATH|nr:LDL receptor wingless signaling/trafficking chaperone [Thalictrum thalictroides]
MQRSSPTLLYSFLFLLILILLQNVGFVRIAEGGKKKVHIPDELDDVEDDEEDEDWKKWGEKSKNDEFDPPRMDPNMDPVTLQAEMMKRHQGPSFGFVKLRFGVKRSPDKVGEIAMKWTKVLKTGSIEANFVAVDLTTLMFTMQRGKDITELIEFVLSDPEAYEVKIGNQKYRRPGDPPLDESNEMEDGEYIADDMEDQDHSNDEL